MSTTTHESSLQRVERKLHLTITYNGVNKPFEPGPQETVRALLDQAVHAFEIAQNAHLLALYTPEGRELQDGKTLEEERVRPKDHLLLRPSAVRGG